MPGVVAGGRGRFKGAWSGDGVLVTGAGAAAMAAVLVRGLARGALRLGQVGAEGHGKGDIPG